jgi:hypothetical protein
LGRKGDEGKKWEKTERLLKNPPSPFDTLRANGPGLEGVVKIAVRAEPVEARRPSAASLLILWHPC